MNDITHIQNVPPPGFFLEEEMEARGWSQSDLAYILGVPVQSINPILSGKRRISTEMAKALGEAFEVSPEFFSNLQTAYDLSQSREPDPAISRRARLQDHFPIREMIKRRWLEDDNGDPSLLEAQLMRIFRANKLENIPYLAHAPKKTSYEERNVPPIQLAWLFRIYQIAREISLPEYSHKKLRQAVDGDLRNLLVDPEEIRYVPNMLADCGVRLVICEPLPQAKIDGVCFWLDGRPVIGMSLRFDRIDNFWFVLRHEIEHVLKRHGKREEIIDDLEGESSGTGESLPEEERIANAAAAEFCTPRNELKSFIARKHPYLSERDILGFARRLAVHPGIVIGQIHSVTGDYRLLRKHLVKIRSQVLPYAVSDGWGDVFPIEL